MTLPAVLGGIKLPPLGWLAWVVLIPLYISLKKSSLRVSFGKGLAFGFGYYGFSLYWIFFAMRNYGEVPFWGSLLGIFLAVLFMSLFMAMAFFLAKWGEKMGAPLVFLFPLVWVMQDLARTFVPFGGFPWASLAYSQHSFTGLLQILDVTGIYGIVFLLLLSNSVLGEWILKKSPSLSVGTATGLFLLLIILVSIYGTLRLKDIRKAIGEGPTLKVGIVQGNIPQDEKWIEEMAIEIIDRHVALSKSVLNEPVPPSLIVWPEAAYPAAVPLDAVRTKFLTEFPVPLLMGAVTYDGEIPEEWPPRPENSTFHLYNSALLIHPGGLIEDRYDKLHLVPMGEYVPLHRWFPFLNQIVPAMGSFTPGKKLNLLSLGEFKFGVTICYEDLFPSISRGFTRNGADFLVNLTNDAWYDYSSALFQHFDFSRYRAIENRRAMVRSTNTGVSGFFSPTGEVIAEASIMEEATLVSEIPLIRVASFYTRYGDIFAWSCVAGFVLLCIVCHLKKEPSCSMN